MALIASCGKNISLWDAKTCTLVDTYPKESVEDWEYTDISWSCDRKSLAVLRLFGPVEILNVEDGKFTSSQTLSPSIPCDAASYPTSVAFMRNSSRYLAVGSKNGAVTLWDCKANCFKKTLATSVPQGSVEFLDFNTIGSHVAAGMSSGSVLVHEYSSNSTNTRYQVPQSTRLTSMRYQPLACASVLGVGSAEGHVAFWNTITGAKVNAVLGAHRKAVTDLAFATDNAKLVASVSLDGRLCFTDFTQRKLVVSCQTTESLTSVDLCEDGVVAVAGTDRGRLLAFDVRSLSFPMATYELQATPVKKLRYNSSTASVSLAAATSTPQRSMAETAVSPRTPSVAEDDLIDGIFSPLRSESQLYSFLASSSSFSTQSYSVTPGRAEYQPDISGVKAETNVTPRSTNNSLLKSVLKATSFEMSPADAKLAIGSQSRSANNQSPLGKSSPLPNGNRTDKIEASSFNLTGMFGDVSATNKIGVVNGNVLSNSGFDFVLTKNSQGSELSTINTSTPEHDDSHCQFPFADPTAEVSPITEMSALALNGSSSELNKGILVDANEIGSVGSEGSVVSDEGGHLFSNVWHSDLSSLSDDLEFHSQRDEAVAPTVDINNADTELVGSANVSADVSMAQILASIQKLQDLVVESFNGLNERLVRLESKLEIVNKE